ncbi:MAG TPA: response regulator, partial [Anaerolineae bacterium]
MNGRETTSILIVDDDREICQLLQTVFCNNGYRTTIAYSGCEALRCVEAGLPDAVVLDVMMPEMDGWETFQRLRDISDVPVLFLTALNSGEHAARALQFDATDYMRKPYSTPELLARVETLLTRTDTRPIFTNGESPNRPLPGRPPIVAVIPAFNEERFIGSVVLKARKYAQTVIVIDDGSSDATAQVARDAGAMVLCHSSNQGKGAALKTAFHMLRDHHPQAVVMLDGDGQHLPEELARVVAPVLVGEADIVVGSRYLEKQSRVPRHRIVGHWVFNWITRVVSGVPASDSQSGYRAFSPKAIEALSFYSNGFSVESEMQFIIRENDLRFVEIPITIRYEDRPKRSVITHGLAVLNGIL